MLRMPNKKPSVKRKMRSNLSVFCSQN